MLDGASYWLPRIQYADCDLQLTEGKLRARTSLSLDTSAAHVSVRSSQDKDLPEDMNLGWPATQNVGPYALKLRPKVAGICVRATMVFDLGTSRNLGSGDAARPRGPTAAGSAPARQIPKQPRQSWPVVASLSDDEDFRVAGLPLPGCDQPL
ncbi:hypothetical protein Vau01_036790 [Virgisporangium aurantiacum]|uniref:Uncharacterized protein n=1 Tax=Virgisporangium aurantiacum TaxID=175570 RepID=A0A8J3Z4J6_9ACTN|nr:hypothetical protein Vau01_036790 [Virgisporangium aurantiacum]